jgi:hypothetical protein
LTAFRPSAPPPGGRWEHHIRPLDAGYRVLVPEVRQLSAFDGRLVTTRVSGGRWELGAVGRSALGRVALDGRDRLVVPPGVRHQLGLCRSVVVSFPTDMRFIALWSCVALDEILGVAE